MWTSKYVHIAFLFTEINPTTHSPIALIHLQHYLHCSVRRKQIACIDSRPCRRSLTPKLPCPFARTPRRVIHHATHTVRKRRPRCRNKHQGVIQHVEVLLLLPPPLPPISNRSLLQIVDAWICSILNQRTAQCNHDHILDDSPLHRFGSTITLSVGWADPEPASWKSRIPRGK